MEVNYLMYLEGGWSGSSRSITRVRPPQGAQDKGGWQTKQLLKGKTYPTPLSGGWDRQLMCQRRMGPGAKLNNEAKRSKCVCKKGTDGDRARGWGKGQGWTHSKECF